MTQDDVVRQFRPLFRAELPDRLARIRAALLAAAGSGTPPEPAFREAHNIAGTAAYMDAPAVVAAAEALAGVVRSALSGGSIPADCADLAWPAYDRLAAAALQWLEQEGAPAAIEYSPARAPKR
jgi:HPt (histidine-containing phosphotransfer) domain-containing protein